MRRPAPAEASNDNRPATALVTALAFARHREASCDRSFGHTKAQKILHVVEYAAGLDLGRNPIADAAGPNDFPHMLAAETWAETHEHFRFDKTGTPYQLQPLSGFGALVRQADAIDPATRKRIDRIIDLFLHMDAREAELFATVYAAWNNLLIDGATISDDAIVRAAREDWHESKLGILRAEFLKALAAVKRSGFTPSGKGKRVGAPPHPQLAL